MLSFNIYAYPAFLRFVLFFPFLLFYNRLQARDLCVPVIHQLSLIFCFFFCSRRIRNERLCYSELAEDIHLYRYLDLIFQRYSKANKKLPPSVFIFNSENCYDNYLKQIQTRMFMHEIQTLRKAFVPLKGALLKWVNLSLVDGQRGSTRSTVVIIRLKIPTLTPGGSWARSLCSWHC